MHDLFGARFVGMRTPAWHNLGTVLHEQVTAQEALAIGGIDYQYLRTPIGYTLPDGTFVQDDNRQAILRTPTVDDPAYRNLGISSSAYTFLQNDELAAGLDAMASKMGWAFETVGALNDGREIFFTLDAGSRSVKGDEFKQYFLVSDGKVSGKALRINIVPHRVVCRNTLISAIDAATLDVKIAHNAAVASDYTFWLDLTGSLEQARLKTFETLDAMATPKITDEQARVIINAAYPLPSKNQRARQAEEIALLDIEQAAKDQALDRLSRGTQSYEYWLNHALRHQEAAVELYQRFNDGAEQGGRLPAKTLKQVAATPYAALQAVTELADWSGRATDEAAARDALFGSRAKVKARGWLAASQLTTSLV